MRTLGPERVHYWRVLRMARVAGAEPARAWDEGRLDRDRWVGAVERCRACPWADGCARWLDRQERRADPSNPDVPGGCMNRDLLTALAREDETEET